MRFRILFILLLFFRVTLWADTVVIKGKAPDYAGTELVFLRYSDQISGSEEILGKVRVQKDGVFSIDFDLEEVSFVYAYPGIYKVYIFVKPGKNYEIILPPRQEKEPGDLLNPYFEPVVVHLATTDFRQDDLNTRIRMFHDAYLPYYNKHILAISNREDFSALDKNIDQMEKPFSASTDTFFNNYRIYKYALLRHLAFQQRTRYISDEFFKDKPVLLNNTAYMELFNQVYDKYFHFFSRTDTGDNLGSAINSQQYDSLRNVLTADGVLGSGNLADLVLLKSLHDEFYDDNFSRSTMLKILDDFTGNCPDEGLKKYALSIRNKVTRLLTGYPPPEFELFDRDSNRVELSDFRGKYVYLNFCSCFSYTCMNEFKMLEKIYDKHSELIEIITVIVDNDPDVINSFLERSNYRWIFLHYGNQSSIIREYDIRAFPTYYLIDREGKLAISPAPAPGEEFEARFFKLLRSRGEL